MLAVLKPLWTRAPETASRLRGRIETVLDFAREDDDTRPSVARWRGHLAKKLPAPRKLARQIGKGRHFRALPYKDVPALVGRLQADTGVAARALEFLLLTAARTSEAIGATWAEIKLDERVWTIPAERMKADQEHTVPLSARALAILDAMRLSFGDEPSSHVFPGRFDGKPLSDMALLALLRRMGVDSTAHGFRRSFRSWAGKTTNFPSRVCEAALAHKLSDKVEDAYWDGDPFEARRKLMDAWAAYCEPPTPDVSDGAPSSNVFALREARAARA